MNVHKKEIIQRIITIEATHNEAVVLRDILASTIRTEENRQVIDVMCMLLPCEPVAS